MSYLLQTSNFILKLRTDGKEYLDDKMFPSDFSVFNQGDEGKSWYIILKGSVNVVIYGKVCIYELDSPPKTENIYCKQRYFCPMLFLPFYINDSGHLQITQKCF